MCKDWLGCEYNNHFTLQVSCNVCVKTDLAVSAIISMSQELTLSMFSSLCGFVPGDTDAVLSWRLYCWYVNCCVIKWLCVVHWCSHVVYWLLWLRFDGGTWNDDIKSIQAIHISQCCSLIIIIVYRNYKITYLGGLTYLGVWLCNELVVFRSDLCHGVQHP